MCIRDSELGADEATIDEVLVTYQLLFSEIVPVDATVAKMALRLGWRSPRRLPLVDALISASAQVRNATLIHRDEHMRGIPADMVQQINFAD